MSEGEAFDLSKGDIGAAKVDNGIHWLVAACFVVGSTAGAGFLSLPLAVDQAGSGGFALFVLIWLVCLYTSKQLSDGTRDAVTCHSYTELAEKAFSGSALGRYTLIMFLDLWFVGASVVYLLLASENANKIWSDVDPCEWVLILGAIMTVLVVVCRNPKDPWFQFITFASTALTLISSVMLCIIMVEVNSTEKVYHTTPSFIFLCSSVSTMIFACGGHPAFPNIQAAMENRAQFSWSLYLGFAVILFMYLPIMIASYVTLGNRAPDNILKAIGADDTASKVATGLMIVHLLLSICIMMNPICQVFERRCGASEGWSVRSAFCRICLMIIVILVAMILPDFDILLTLIGSAIVTWLGFVFPPIFTLRLRRNYDMSPCRRLAHCCLSVIGFVSMVVLTVGCLMFMVREKRFLESCFTNFRRKFIS